MRLSHNLRGSIFMAVAMASFTLVDTITKSLVTTMNNGQMILVRGLFATALIGLLAWRRGALRRPSQALHPLVALRAVCELAATIAFMTALRHMPLSNTTAVLQALPLAVALGAALFLGETVRRQRWLAIAAGFAGVLLVIRPGFEGFNVFSLLALVAVVFYGLRDLLTKRIPGEVPSLLVSTVTAFALTVFGGLLIPVFGGWGPMTAGQIGLMIVAAVLLITGYQAIILATREGDISFVAPFRYTALVWSLALGFIVFGEVPDAPMIVGTAVIILSGLYALHQERLGLLTLRATSVPAPASDGDGEDGADPGTPGPGK